MISRRQLITGLGAGLVVPVTGLLLPAAAAPMTGVFSGFYRDLADDSTSYFFAVNPGPEANNRVLVAAIHTSGGEAGDLTSVMIGGASATIHVSLRGASNDLVALASAGLATGADGLNVHIKLATPHARCAIGLWTIYPTSNKPTTYASEFRKQTAPSVAAKIPPGALCICAFQGASTRVSWEGADVAYEESVESYLAASGASTGDPAQITATPTRVPNDCGLVACVWA